jgi:AraC family transcriptional regulator of adaptative response/methylated-DNA-[protein]-cysteine methyltransferase
VPVEVRGTPFEMKVWEELQRIPYGETRSYADMAQRIGSPAAVRAVGRANGLNAIAIVVPCHRVVNKNGDLGGYGGGLWRKRRLLHLEAASTREPRHFAGALPASAARRSSARAPARMLPRP